MITPIKIESNPALVDVCNNCGIDHYEFAENLAKALYNRNLVNEWGEGYGMTLDVWLEDAPINDVCEAIKEAGITDITTTEFLAIMEAIVKGNGDCPECGGTMEIDEDWDDYGNKFYIYRCPICGHSFSEYASGHD